MLHTDHFTQFYRVQKTTENIEWANVIYFFTSFFFYHSDQTHLIFWSSQSECQFSNPIFCRVFLSQKIHNVCERLLLKKSKLMTDGEY